MKLCKSKTYSRKARNCDKTENPAEEEWGLNHGLRAFYTLSKHTTHK